jgi:hypothetical protein
MTLGHQGQKLPFTRGQRAQGVFPALPGQQLGNDLRIEHRRAVGDPAQGVQEFPARLSAAFSMPVMASTSSTRPG